MNMRPKYVSHDWLIGLWISASPVKATGRDEQEVGEEEEAQPGNVTLKETTEKTPAPTGFTVLGGFKNKPVQKVQCLCPEAVMASPTALLFNLWSFSARCCSFVRCTESCLSGSLSRTWFTETSEATWSPSPTSRDSPLCSWENCKLMESINSFQVTTLGAMSLCSATAFWSPKRT